MNYYLQTFLRSLPAIAILAIAGGLILAFGEGFQIRVAYLFFVNLVMVVGLQIFMGNSNVASLGHISFAGIAGYVVAVLCTPIALKATMIPEAPFGVAEVEMNAVVASLIALGITGAIAFVTGLGLSRLTGVAATIGTLALLVVVHVFLINWVGLTRGPRAFYGIPVVSSLPIAIAAAGVAIFIAKLFRDSRDGVQLRASGDNLLAAKSMGVSVERQRLKAWVVSALVVGMGGVLYTLYIGTIAPKSFYFHQTFLTVAMLILGGMRSVSGAVTGAIVVAVGFELVRMLENGPEILGVDLPEMFGLTGFFLGAVIVLSLAFRPSGLMGDDEWEDYWPRLKRKFLGPSR